ncbi:MAG: sugar phosphate isomerase/epimerase [Clostridia bacterium]|nr:sugar phosphate isomerase/epimerase [Clostridia bacterium]
MKIGVCMNLYSVEQLEDQLKTLCSHGFDTCQLICWNTAFFTDEIAAQVKALFEQYKVTPSAFWCGWSGPCVWNFYEGQQTIGLVPPEYREMRVKELCDGSDFAKVLGIENVVTHMGFIPEDPNDPRFAGFCDAVRIVAEYCKKNGQYLLFETGQETPVTMLRTFEVVGTDNLGVNLDTANLILYGRANPVDALDVFGKYVRNLHAKDGKYPTNGHDLGEEIRLGDGKVDFKGVFEALKAHGYDGPVTIEREISGEQQIEDINHARKLLTSVIKEVYGPETEC